MHRAFLKDICSLKIRRWIFAKSWVWSQIRVRHLADMAWQYSLSIPVGRRDVLYWFKWLPVWYRNGSGLGIFDHFDIGCRTVRQFRNTLKRWKRIRTVLHPARPQRWTGIRYLLPARPVMAMERDTPSTSILLAVERDTPCTSIDDCWLCYTVLANAIRCWKIIGKFRNAGKKSVRRRHFFRKSTASVRHRDSSIRVSPVPLVTDLYGIAQLCM